MEECKETELYIPSVLGCEKTAMDFVASVAKKTGLADERIEDLKTAVSEACLNAIEHGNKLNASTKVGVSITVDGSRLQVDVQDEGKGVGQIVPPNIEDMIEKGERPRGWGIFLIRNLVDELEFKADSDGGNVVRMIIHLER